MADDEDHGTDETHTTLVESGAAARAATTSPIRQHSLPRSHPYRAPAGPTDKGIAKGTVITHDQQVLYENWV